MMTQAELDRVMHAERIARLAALREISHVWQAEQRHKPRPPRLRSTDSRNAPVPLAVALAGRRQAMAHECGPLMATRQSSGTHGHTVQPVHPIAIPAMCAARSLPNGGFIMAAVSPV
jgi:hypothetical protein